MNTPRSLGLFVAAASSIAACSSDEGTPRDPVGGAGTTALAGTGGQVGSAGGTGGSTGGTGGTGGAAPSGPPQGRLGTALSMPAEGPVVDTIDGTEISGGQAVTQSSVMTTDAVISRREGGLCFSGVTATVPNTSSYGTHWGAEMIFDLKRGANPNAPPPAADAGADAGEVLGEVAQDWPKGNVIGFAYTLVGNNPDLPGAGVPNAQVRFKAAPVGANTAQDNYCSSRTPTSGTPEFVLFSDIIFECWAMGNYSLADDPIQFVEQPDPNKVVGTRPNPGAFRSISWQIASDIMIDPIAFDFCVEDLTPILAN